MDLTTAQSRLQAKANPKVAAVNLRNGAGDAQYGVALGDIRVMAIEAGLDAALSRALWATGNLDARLLALLTIRPRDLSPDEVDTMVRGNRVMQVADWLSANILKAHPAREALRLRWMADEHPMAARAGWSLTADRLAKDRAGLDPVALLDRIDTELATAPAPVQWTMNMALAMIGIHLPDLRGRAVAMGERLGVYRDFPVSKGCTSPFAPIWIAEMVRRAG